MPAPVTRFLLLIGVILTATMLCCVSTPVAVAEPDEPGNSSEDEGETPPGNVDEPEPSVSPAPTPAPTPTMRSLPDQLRDFLNRPLSIFGNGRLPGVPTGTPKVPATEAVPGGDVPDEAAEEKSGGRGGAPKPEVGPPPTPAPQAQAPVWTGSTAEVRLPFTPAFSVPVATMPGAERRVWSINLTDPASTYATIEETVATFNSLLADAYAPYDPFPKPPPGPAMRTFQEEPVLDVGGDGAGIGPLGDDGGGIPPLVQMPAVPAAVPVAVPRAVSTRPAGEGVRGVSPVPEVVAGGSAGVSTPAIRGSVQPTSTAAPAGPGGVPTGNPALRQGYSQYLRMARLGELAAVALPGVTGLLALTLSGGVIGYRQANAGRYLRQESARFVR